MRFQNFELEEFLVSGAASARHIDNTPTFDVVWHLDELIDKILQPLRVAWGSGLRITSGYRCPELNRAVGGSSSSAHVAGYAADVVPVNGKVDEFWAFAESWLRSNNVAFDQSIREVGASGERWWHIGVRNQAGMQRRQFLHINENK